MLKQGQLHEWLCKMMIRKFLPFLLSFAFLPLSAQAGEIPFFSTYPQIDQKTWYISDGWTNGDHQSCEWRADAVSVVDHSVVFTVSNRGGKVRPIGCGDIHTKKFYTYGRYEARLRTAAGSGLNTAFFTFTGTPYGVDAHDEIDFEFLGKNSRTVELTLWSGHEKYPGGVIDLGFDASKEFHNYAFEWDRQEVRWYIDDKLVYKTPPGTPVPTHQQLIFIDLWSGAAQEDAWMGKFTYTKPVSAEFAWVRYTPFK